MLRSAASTLDSGAARAPSPAPRSPGARWVGAFLLGLGVLFVWNLWVKDFWNPGEPRYALLTASLEGPAGLLVPRLDERPVFQRPPLVYWLSGASRFCLRLDPRLSYRLPIVLFAVLGLWLTYIAGRYLADGRIGFLAALIQGSTVAYYARANRLDDDLVFAVCCQLALTSFVLGTRPGAAVYWKHLAWIGLAGAALSKSILLGFGLVFGCLVLYLFFDPDTKAIRSTLKRLSPVSSLVVFAVLTAPWYVLVTLEYGGAFLDGHFVRTHFARLFDAASHPRLPHYYVVAVLGGFLPWTILLPLGVVHIKDRLKRPCERFCLVTIIFSLVALSLVSSKKPGYVLLIWPALSLAVAAGLFETRERFSLWEDYLREFPSRILPLLLGLPLLAAVLLVGSYLSGYLPATLAFVGRLSSAQEGRLTRLLEEGPGWIYVGGLLLLAGGLCLSLAPRVHRLNRKKEYPRAAFEFSCAVLFIFFVGNCLYGGLNRVKSSRYLLEEVAAVTAGAPLAVYGYKRPSISYYLDRPLQVLPYPDVRAADAGRVIRSFLLRDETVYILASRSEYTDLRQLFLTLRPHLHERELTHTHLGWTREYVLLSNKPDPKT